MTQALRPLSTADAPHYTWGDGCDGWHLCSSDTLSVIEEAMPAGASETRHRHATAEQVFYVLTGGLQIEVEGEVLSVGAGQSLHIAAGLAHQVRSDSAARFLVISTPPAQSDRIAA